MKQAYAAVSRAKSQPLILECIGIDEPRSDEILVRIVASGVCHTDMVVRDQGYDVPQPLVLGHEGSGVVEKVGADVKGLQAGDHVALSYAYCGKCEKCLSGTPFYCVDFFGRNFRGTRPDGSCPLHDSSGKQINGCFFEQSSFATFAIATERNAVKIPKDIPLELIGPLGCGLQTGAGAVLNCLRPKKGASLAIFGAGAVGLAAAMAARIAECGTIIVVDLNRERLELAKELGATHTVNAREVDSVKAIHEIVPGGVDFSLECTSSPKVFRQAVDCLGVPGTCGLVGSSALGTEASIDIGSFLFGRTLVGVVEGQSIPSTFVPELIGYWREGRFPFEKLVQFYDLSDINQAMADSESGKVIKPIVKMKHEPA
ncbi:NAD(P)-dependent alcohol dehydrogenase (plasmid) [Agrobacterium tumefaciens]|uniref:NAD(P)-dependent alcohol dehydrogenase n=1 Tax=Agrobacterium tumefaciens TaxID=358 RepID=UPI0009C79ADE|nr:NAD(P)-dependent alcohol dehydrogenase [Agrobacterium tumefaciens]QCM08725.1 NAD(P)-dependent alcohol dehydrogenase [Agrobacterium tumefaciens]WCJ66242.1 NAD(P)-dependent alcohol dehydrogenase [Agrobacterium tumefaciens]CUX68753.1 Aryl-alcohol dehydrogenase [Agrobacterium genomosp. 5 str. CFBP 6626]